MVIQGSEPMLVDTGSVANRKQWLADVFSLVEPEAVRWIFLSHDDSDHIGNLDAVMEACPNATLVCNWAIVERYSITCRFPLERCRWIMHGDSIDIGDRTLQAVRPPVFDSPTTRDLFDPTTGVYWAVDAFASPLPDPAMGVADLDPEFWTRSLHMFAVGAVSPRRRLRYFASTRISMRPTCRASRFSTNSSRPSGTLTEWLPALACEPHLCTHRES